MYQVDEVAERAETLTMSISALECVLQTEGKWKMRWDFEPLNNIGSLDF